MKLSAKRLFGGEFLFVIILHSQLPIMESDLGDFTSTESEIRFTIYNTSPPFIAK